MSVSQNDFMEIRRNDESALPRFAALNAAWIEDLHYLEESDKLMVAHPEIYTHCLLYTSPSPRDS